MEHDDTQYYEPDNETQIDVEETQTEESQPPNSTGSQTLLQALGAEKVEQGTGRRRRWNGPGINKKTFAETADTDTQLEKIFETAESSSGQTRGKRLRSKSKPPERPSEGTRNTDKKSAPAKAEGEKTKQETVGKGKKADAPKAAEAKPKATTGKARGKRASMKVEDGEGKRKKTLEEATDEEPEVENGEVKREQTLESAKDEAAKDAVANDELAKDAEANDKAAKNEKAPKAAAAPKKQATLKRSNARMFAEEGSTTNTAKALKKEAEKEGSQSLEEAATIAKKEEPDDDDDNTPLAELPKSNPTTEKPPKKDIQKQRPRSVLEAERLLSDGSQTGP